MRGALAAVLLTACSFEPGVLPGDAAVTSDIPIDEPASSFDCTTWSTSYFDGCMLPASDRALVLSGGEYVYDTTTRELRDPNNALVDHEQHIATERDPDLHILVVRSLLVEADARLRVKGTLPFAIAARGSIAISGVIDVGARMTEPGAGARASCAGTMKGQDDTGGAGGGGGGGFGGAGGTGGMGDLNGPGSASGGAAGPALPLPTSIIGGCAGALGGQGDDLGGAGGVAGGGIVIASATGITVAGRVRASGGGGRGGVGSGGGDSGGGGGGSGGMIAIETPMLDVGGGVIVANGGGGGEGSETGKPGNPGDDGTLTSTAAAGGTGATDVGADGGTGGVVGSVDGKTPTEHLNGGGGGGGGGVGHIVLRAAARVGTAAVISPAPQP